LRFIPWNPCACNFARHTFLSGRHLAGIASMGSTPEQQQRIVAQCGVGIV
jgi:hypothetical protein